MENCNKSNFNNKQTSHIWSAYDTKEVTQFIQFVFWMLMPIVCLLGIVTNSLVLITVKHKSNQKALKENQYSYMSLNACCNLFMLAFQAIRLTSECQVFNGVFCSSVRKSLFIQFYRIIFVEYLTHVLNVMANLSYIIYSISRLSLVGQDHGKFVTMMSKIRVRRFILMSFLFCLVLPASKIFTFRPNFSTPVYEYPDTFEAHLITTKYSIILLYYASNIAYFLTISFGFIVSNLVIDISLLVSLKKVIADRANTILSEEVQKKKRFFIFYLKKYSTFNFSKLIEMF